MISVVSGFLAGLTHALTGPDHLAAVTPIALERTAKPWLIGLRWGLGHSLGVCLVAMLFLALRDLLPITRLSAISDRLAGLTLIAVGIWAFRKSLRLNIHTHSHSHGGTTHTHVHAHRDQPSHAHGRSTHAALGIGTLHGLGGSSHLLGVLPSLALPSFTDSAAYLAAFALGTVAAMTCLSSVLGAAAQRLKAATGLVYRRVLAATACLTALVGTIWVITGGI